jgi:hypothetical protein
MKSHFNIILPILYQSDTVSVIIKDVHILGVYGNGVLTFWRRIFFFKF